jgi:hypothetical protein
MLPNESYAPDARTVAGRALILHYAIERVAFTSVSGMMSLFSPFASEAEKKEFTSGMSELVSVTIDLLQGLGLWTQLTPRERRVFEAPPDRLGLEDQAAITRDAEAIVVLLWALGRIDTLPPWNREIEGSLLMDVIGNVDDETAAIEAFLKGATLRKSREIQTARREIVARARELPALPQAAADVARDTDVSAVLATRLKAFDWLCGTLATRDWDDAVPTEL